MRTRLYPHPALGVLLWLQYLRYSPLAPHHELLWQRHRLLQVGVRKDNKKSRGRPLLFIFISVSARLKLAEYAKQDKKAIFRWMTRKKTHTGRSVLGVRVFSHRLFEA